MIEYEDISHLAMEVTDLEAAEKFYREALGMEVICRDDGELGKGRLILRNGSGQLLFLEKVDELSARSRFCGPDANKVPDPGAGLRYKGAHLAMSVSSVEEYDEIYKKLEPHGAYLEGDLRAAERAPGEKSVYFYDPFGNRLQLIILPA
jgi:catechol 2,3-dioxygenase-like lactoylglutathione lyase family enzyme